MALQNHYDRPDDSLPKLALWEVWLERNKKCFFPIHVWKLVLWGASVTEGSNFESCVWRTVSPQSSHHPQEVLLAQFSLHVHKGGLKPDSFHFFERSTVNPNNLIHVPRCILYLYVTWQYTLLCYRATGAFTSHCGFLGSDEPSD